MSYGNLFNDNKQTATKEHPVLSGEFVPASKNLPENIKDVDGNTYKVSYAEISKFGMGRSQNSADLNNQILKKTMVADSGMMEQSVTQIMTLTQKVDINALRDEGGLFNKLRNKFQDAKVRVQAQYTSVEGQIDSVVKHISTELVKMRDEADWLQKVYEENDKDIVHYTRDLEIMREFMAKCEERYNYLQANSTNNNEVEDARLLFNAVSRQVDILVKLKAVSDVTAPEVRAMQESNILVIEKYNSIISATIPLWKKQMGLALKANADKQRILTAQKVDNFTDTLLKETAKQVGQNMIDSTKAAQSNVASADAITEAMAMLTKDIQESIRIDKESHRNRLQNAAKIESATNDMKLALRG